jgi:hypothetical protein
VEKLISYRLYDSSSNFSTVMLEASKKYPRRVMTVIDPRLKILNNFLTPDKFIILLFKRF